MLKPSIGILLLLGVVALVPPGLIALSRARPSDLRPPHPVLDMDKQSKFKAQWPNPMFADRRSMRPVLPGVLADSDLKVPNEGINDPELLRMLDDRSNPITPTDAVAHDRIFLGIEPQSDGRPASVTKIPLPVTIDLMRRGQERYGVYCAPCHGLSGYGDGMVARRAADMQSAGADTAAGWVAPASYHSDELRKRSVGSLYNTIHQGVRSMPAYGGQVSVVDRWAIVAYVKALQRSQNAKLEDVPETERQKLGK